MERNLQQHALEGNPVIKYKNLRKKMSDFPSLHLFVKYMETSGLLVKLKSSLDANDDIVIDTQWLTDAFKEVINHDKSKLDSGKLKLIDTKELWKADRFKGNRHILLKFMENLGLISKPFEHDLDGSFYYIPSRLPPAPENKTPTEVISEWLDPHKPHISKTLVLDYRKNNKQVPFPHFDKFMAKFISQQSEDAIRAFQRHYCIIKDKNSSIGFILCQGCSLIKITMFTRNKSAYENMSSGLNGQNLLRIVTDISEGLAAQFSQRIPSHPIKGISCNPYPSTADKEITYCKLEELRQVADGDEDRECCSSPRCDMVKKKDIDLWEGKKIELNLLSISKITLCACSVIRIQQMEPLCEYRLNSWQIFFNWAKIIYKSRFCT